MPEFEIARRARLAEALVARELSCVLVTDLINVRYLSGFTGSHASFLVLADGRSWLATDSRYQLQAAAECPEVVAVITRDCSAELVASAAKLGCTSIGFEDRTMSVRDHQSLSGDTSADFEQIGSLVSDLRMVKDERELGFLRQACSVSDLALAAVLPRIRPGVSEQEVARWLDDEMRDMTAQGPGFETIVAAGENSAIPHHTPTNRPLFVGDLLKMDFGACVAGYHADMTRTVVLGAPTEWQQEIHAVVSSAQLVGRQALSATATAAEVDRAARTVVEEAGYGQAFGHGLGHGVGLEIHEAPFLGSTSADRLAAAVPVTVEPGVYLPGRGGVRIEDTVVVHHDQVELLTTTTRELLVLD